MRHLLPPALLVLAACLAACDSSTGPDDELQLSLREPDAIQIEVDVDRVRLTWQDRSEGEDGYRIERAVRDSLFEEIATLDGDTVTSYEESVQGRLFALYRVSAFKNLPTEMETGPQATASYSLGPDSATVLIERDDGNLDRIDLTFNVSWNDKSTFESGFIVERRRNFGLFEEVARTESDVLTLSDNVQQSGRYVYRVRAFTASSESAVVEDTVFASGWVDVPGSTYVYPFNDAVALEDGTVFLSDTGNGGYVLFDPASNTWSVPTFHEIQGVQSQAHRLAGGDVFIMAQYSYAALYDGAAGTFREIGCPTSLPSELSCPFDVVFDDGLRSVLLQNGDVLITGMSAGAEAYANRFTPGTESFLQAAPPNERRKFHTLTLLPTGSVLAAGGSTSPGTATPTASTELYDPQTDTWSDGPDMPAALVYHTAVALDDGSVLVCGDEAERSCARYDPVANAWTPTPAFRMPEILTMVKLQDGKVLALTGDNHRMPQTTELYDPENEIWIVVSPPLNDLTFQARRLGTNYTMTLLDDGRMLFTGDRSATGGVPALLWRN